MTIDEFSQFVKANRERLVRVFPIAYYADAEDAFQDICVLFLQKPEKLEERSEDDMIRCFYKYMRRRFQQVRYGQHSNVSVESSTLGDGVPLADRIADIKQISPEDAYYWAECQARFELMKRTLLTDRQQEIWDAHCEGTSDTAIGRLFGISRQAVGKHIELIQKKFIAA